MVRTAVNVSGDGVVSTIVAKGEGKPDLAIRNDPAAGLGADTIPRTTTGPHAHGEPRTA